MNYAFGRTAVAAVAILFISLTSNGEAPVQQLPVGTLLPAQLNSSIDSGKAKPGQKISARLKQNVPLPDNGLVKAGAKIVGHLVSVTPGSKSSGAKLVLVFDTLRSEGRDYPITTSLRALASMDAVYQARLPINGSIPDNLSVWDWNTRQIGGEIVFGGGRRVEGLTGVVGTMVEPGWVIGVARPNPEAGCDDTGNKSLQAFWLFSTDACGTYGWDGLQISRAPDDAAAGKIVLTSGKKIEIRSGGGLLLMIEKQAGAGTS